jgi:threonine synthase
VTPADRAWPGFWLQALHHGPTLAFKDVAMQLLARLYERALADGGRRLTIVTATSGDTGGAAVDAFAGREGVNLVVLFPEGRISAVQRRFMTANAAGNIRCVAVEGDFDDCQAIVKSLFGDTSFRDEVDLSGVNSINFARIAAQAVYYFTSAIALGAPERPVAFAVPTGNFGDAFAGWVAKRMGLPISRIIVATNVNDILARTFQDGPYRRGTGQATMSPAWTSGAQQLERLYFEASRRDGAETARAFAASRPGLDCRKARPRFMARCFGAAVERAETATTMRRVLGDRLLIDRTPPWGRPRPGVGRRRHAARGASTAHRPSSRGGRGRHRPPRLPAGRADGAARATWTTCRPTPRRKAYVRAFARA